MKIAIVFSGFPNITEEFKKHFYEAICVGDHEFDFYAHAWGEGKERDLLSEFAEFKDATVEKQRPFHAPIGWREDFPPQNTFGQLYSISESFKIALNSGIDYDFYVRCRFDVFVGEKINYDVLNKEKCWMLPLGKSNPPKHSQPYIERINILPLPKDFFWICNKDTAKICTTFYDNITDYNLNGGIVLCPEDLMFHHLAVNNVKISLLLQNLENGLYRQNHHHGNGLVLYNEKGPYQKNELSI